MKNVLAILLLPCLAFAQAKFEVQEFTGTVKSIGVGWGFAYEVIRLDIDGERVTFSFPPDYGKVILEKVRVNDVVRLRVNVNVSIRKRMEGLKPEERSLVYRDGITEIFLDGAWFPLPISTLPPLGFNPKVFLEKRVVDIYRQKYNGQLLTRALVFENGLIGGTTFHTQKIADIKTGDVVSFVGFPFPVREGMAYPIAGVNAVYHLGLLSKGMGRLKSLLFKQNNVCIGIVMKMPDDTEVPLGFPSDYAKSIRTFLTNKESVTFYFNSYKVEKLIEPVGVQAFVAGADTLVISTSGFYGGTDVHHDHIPSEVSGTITAVNRSAQGAIMSLIVNKEVYVEVDLNMSQQLGSLIRKGKGVIVKGDERIKKDGEIYQKDFRIITPRQITVDGKEFLLK